MDVCPKCGRKLLSHSSKRCNWCGEELSDPDYVRQAEANRAAYFLHDRLEAAAEAARVGAFNPLFGLGLIPGGPYIGDAIPPGPALPVAQPVAQAKPPESTDTESAEAIPTPEEETAERAKHLEL